VDRTNRTLKQRMEQEQQFYLDQDGVAYTVLQPDQGGTFQNLQTLVEVSSLLAGQQEPIQQGHGVAGYSASPAPQTITISQRPTILPQRSNSLQPEIRETIMQAEHLPIGENQNVREKKPRKRGGAAQVRPCHLCGERAGKHRYYGGDVCPSCRAFFRRSVQSGYNATYCCVKDGSCEVTSKTRKNCQFCRYKLCLAVGMKSSWVLTEEERKQKFEGKGKKKRKLEDLDEEYVDNNLAVSSSE